MISLMKTHGLYHVNLNNTYTCNLVHIDYWLWGYTGNMKFIQVCPPLEI